MRTLFTLVGAGAGPDISTSVVTSALTSWDGLAFPSVPFGTSSPPSTPFFTWLLRASAEAFPLNSGSSFGFRPPVGAANFEELIHLLERLSYLLQEPYYDSVFRRPPPYETSFYELSALAKLLQAYKPMSIYDVIIRACNFILDTVAEMADANPSVPSVKVVSALKDVILRQVDTGALKQLCDCRPIADALEHNGKREPHGEQRLVISNVVLNDRMQYLPDVIGGL